MSFWRGFTLTWISVLGITQVNAGDCSSFAAAPWTGIPYAYKFFLVMSNSTYSGAMKYCNGLGISGSQLAICRNRETTIFLWKNLTKPDIPAGGSAYIGMQHGANYVWNDGKICDWSDPNDERCYNSTQFDGSGSYVVFFDLYPWNDKILFDDTAIQPLSFLCEVPRKFVPE
jgi:hypothetical protein